MLESILIMGIYFMFIFVPFILVLPIVYIICRVKFGVKESFIEFIKNM